MAKRPLHAQVYEELSSATGVAPDDVEKVLAQLGFAHAVNNLTRVAKPESVASINAKQLQVEIMIDKAILVK